jgi:hypothetical protein
MMRERNIGVGGGIRGLGYKSNRMKGSGGNGISMIISNCGRSTEYTTRQTTGHGQGRCRW